MVISHNIARVSLHFIIKAVEGLGEVEIAQLEGHYAKYFAWMKSQIQDASSNKLAPDSSTWLEDHTHPCSVEVQICSKLGGSMAFHPEW